MRHRLAALALLLVVGGPLVAGSDEPRSPELPSPEVILEGAFENQYDVATTATIELVVANARGQKRSRLLETASKVIDGRQHSIGRLVAPEYLRGMTILQIEAADRGHDAFVYMPAMQAIRRVTTAQRGDALFGTDVTYEDLDRRRIRDYRITHAFETTVAGEAAVCILAEPRRPRSFHSVRFDVARADGALLETAYFKLGADEPYRRISASRAHMERRAGHTLPTRLVVENRDRGTTTDVFYRGLEIAPEIDDRIFSLRTLEQKGRIPVASR